MKFRVFSPTIVNPMRGSFTIKEAVEFDNVTFSEDNEIMQYTGLTDKNGVEIYEGDIIKNPAGAIGVVKWVTARFEVVYTDSQLGKINWQLYSSGALEVIGNIHENPELLK